ncbi:MAG: hypothetical protein KIT83_04885 [Bryobacterales bacterium]|nr:hypothetical protein [Bryobacterales bacterium]
MQHVNIKLFAEQPYPKDIAAVIPVFHRWIQQKSLPGLLIDVADYAHVPQGPGVLLIAHGFDVSLDEAGGRLGLLYNRKEPWEGSGLEALRSAYAFAQDVAKRVAMEPEFAGKLRFGTDELQITLNDRLLYPNSPETLAAVGGELGTFLGEVFGGTPYTIERSADPRARFSVTVRVS